MQTKPSNPRQPLSPIPQLRAAGSPGSQHSPITKNGAVQAMQLDVLLDRRATCTLANRKAKYDAAERTKGKRIIPLHYVQRPTALRHVSKPVGKTQATVTAWRSPLCQLTVV